jgi:hypothetical protein
LSTFLKMLDNIFLFFRNFQYFYEMLKS